VKDIAQNHNPTPKKLDINGKVIPLRTSPKGARDSRKKWGGSIKRRCRAKFTIKTFICLNMYWSYVSFNKIMLNKMVYMSMGI
jgi:hypothetical protein